MTMNSYFIKRNCPCCGAQPQGSASIKAPVAAETMDFAALQSSWLGFFKEKTFFTYIRCLQCDLLYAPQFFSPEKLQALYGQMPPNMDVVDVEILRKTQRGYFEVLKNYTTLNGQFLEIGPDIGLFTENCVREGAFSSYWLFEPNRDVSDALTRTMKGQNFHIIHDMFGFEAVEDDAIHVAVMVHVLDHLLDPVATLQELRRKMQPNGILLIVTHDESSLLRRIMGWRWPAFCLQHPELYRFNSMKNVLARAGFETIAQEKTVNYFPIQFLLRHGLFALGLQGDFIPSFGGRAIGLKLGNMLTLAKPAI